MRIRAIACIAMLLVLGPLARPARAAVDPAAYPWPAQNGWVLDGHGYWEGECTSFVAWAVRHDGIPQDTSPDFLGDARYWHGVAVTAAPRPGDVAQWDAYVHGADSLGHVAYVVSANAGATYTVEEYNWYAFHRFDIRVISPTEPSRYLRF
jgi:surface antigen